MSPDPLSEFVTAVMPSFVAGMLALATALVLFGFQQRSARRARRREQLDAAFEHVMDGFRALQDGVLDLSRTQTPDDLADSMLRFAWLLNRRDHVVALWVMMKGNEAMSLIQQTQSIDQRRIDVGALKAEVGATLKAWRDGVITRRWMLQDLERLGPRLGLTPEQMGISPRRSARHVPSPAPDFSTQRD